MPTYSAKELKEWLYSQEEFHVLYDNWKRLDYQRDYVPSVDRKNDYIGYTMHNIQLMTWRENNEKCHKDKLSGANNKQSNAVVQCTKQGVPIREYYSGIEAERSTGINQSNIHQVCRGFRKTAGGFAWIYSDLLVEREG